LETETKTAGIGKWLKDNITKFAGMLVFLPVLLSINAKVRNTMAIFSFLWILFSPTESIIQYTCQAILLFYFNKLSNKTDKLYIAILGVVLTFSGFLIPLI